MKKQLEEKQKAKIEETKAPEAVENKEEKPQAKASEETKATEKPAEAVAEEKKETQSEVNS